MIRKKTWFGIFLRIILKILKYFLMLIWSTCSGGLNQTKMGKEGILSKKKQWVMVESGRFRLRWILFYRSMHVHIRMDVIMSHMSTTRDPLLPSWDSIKRQSKSSVAIVFFWWKSWASLGTLALILILFLHILKRPHQ